MIENRPPRPLDEHELRVLEEITRATERDDPELMRLLDGTEGIVHPPVRSTGTRLSWRVVLTVMTLATLYATVIGLLPDHLVLPVVVGMQLVLIPVCCLLWARRRGEL